MIYEVKCAINLEVETIEPDGMSFREENGGLLYHIIKIKFKEVFPFTSNGKTSICNEIRFTIQDYLNLYRKDGVTWSSAVDKTDIFIRNLLSGYLDLEDYKLLTLVTFNETQKTVYLKDIDDKELMTILIKEIQKAIIEKLL